MPQRDLRDLSYTEGVRRVRRGAIIIALVMVFGNIVLVLSLAFGLGGRDLAGEYLKKETEGGRSRRTRSASAVSAVSCEKTVQGLS
jgi:hypothetical protein